MAKNELSLPIPLNSEKLAYWFFRLNGFLTISNFIIHPDQGYRQRTDLDILACRFPHRAELLEKPMVDDKLFTSVKGKPLVVIAEVKKKTCDLNGPWTNRDAKNMHRVLRAIGIFPEELVNQVASSLYEHGYFENEYAYFTLFCIGQKEKENLKRKYPCIPQISWKYVLEFIYERFRNYHKQKLQHSQWDTEGQQLWDIAMHAKSKEEFVNSIQVE